MSNILPFGPQVPGEDEVANWHSKPAYLRYRPATGEVTGYFLSASRNFDIDDDEDVLPIDHEILGEYGDIYIEDDQVKNKHEVEYSYDAKTQLLTLECGCDATLSCDNAKYTVDAGKKVLLCVAGEYSLNIIADHRHRSTNIDLVAAKDKPRDSRYVCVINNPLEDHRKVVLSRIDDASNTSFRKLISNPFYDAKFKEAQDVLKGKDDGLDFVKEDADTYGITIKQAAQRIVDARNACEKRAKEVEKLRVKMKQQARQAKSHEELAAIDHTELFGE